MSDGRSHLIDFQVNDVAVGESGSELKAIGGGGALIYLMIVLLCSFRYPSLFAA